MVCPPRREHLDAGSGDVANTGKRSQELEIRGLQAFGGEIQSLSAEPANVVVDEGLIAGELVIAPRRSPASIEVAGISPEGSEGDLRRLQTS